MSIDHPHGGGKEPRKPKPTKPFNQFSSEMAELSEKLKALDTKIQIGAQKHGVVLSRENNSHLLHNLVVS